MRSSSDEDSGVAVPKVFEGRTPSASSSRLANASSGAIHVLYSVCVAKFCLILRANHPENPPVLDEGSLGWADAVGVERANLRWPAPGKPYEWTWQKELKGEFERIDEKKGKEDENTTKLKALAGDSPGLRHNRNVARNPNPGGQAA